MYARQLIEINIFNRSCDLDEWTKEQLDIMTLSGNGNARAFFKKHGCTEEQMQSEKKYKTKAAQEYRRHLAKLIEGGNNASMSLQSTSNDPADKEQAWESSTGLDNLMRSVSGNSLSSQGNVPESVFSAVSANKSSSSSSSSSTSSSASSSVSAPVTTQTPSASSMTPAPIGSLSVSSAIVGNGGAADDDWNVSAADVLSPTDKSVPQKVLSKKPITSKKGLGARKLDANPADVRLESFESVEKRASKAAQEAEDNKLATQMQQLEFGGSSRVAAAYQEAVAPPSIYRAAAAPIASTSSYSSNSAKSFSGVGKPQSSSAASESYAAREKYSGAKSISSDQFFGRDEEDSFAIRTRLEKYGNSTAIGSDMLYNDEPEFSSGGGGLRGGGGYSDSNSNNPGLAKLKDSVGDFFNDIQRRLG